ncbi:hypothetical protein M0R45_036108 [Rubus argutus]|uniref:Uncharacterized protein n=1 Tax=Rubus argutus TaxID=59490 RepID=A0AAW1VYS0_RUBAR
MAGAISIPSRHLLFFLPCSQPVADMGDRAGWLCGGEDLRGSSYEQWARIGLMDVRLLIWVWRWGEMMVVKLMGEIKWCGEGGGNSGLLGTPQTGRTTHLGRLQVVAMVAVLEWNWRQIWVFKRLG